jgi:hypothetical protein
MLHLHSCMRGCMLLSYSTAAQHAGGDHVRRGHIQHAVHGEVPAWATGLTSAQLYRHAVQGRAKRRIAYCGDVSKDPTFRPRQTRPGQARPIASSTLHQHTALHNQTGCCCPALLQDDTVALCLTPQGYHNIRPGTDIFNNVNLGFWEYILPGEACCLLPGPAACTHSRVAASCKACPCCCLTLPCRVLHQPGCSALLPTASRHSLLFCSRHCHAPATLCTKSDPVLTTACAAS